MRKNEYNNLEEFIAEYSGGRNPANDKWFGLEFLYHNTYYRLDISSGKYVLQKILFKHKETYPNFSDYELLGVFNTIEELLLSKTIENTKFKEIIMDDSTLLLSKD